MSAAAVSESVLVHRILRCLVSTPSRPTFLPRLCVNCRSGAVRDGADRPQPTSCDNWTEVGDTRRQVSPTQPNNQGNLFISPTEASTSLILSSPQRLRGRYRLLPGGRGADVGSSLGRFLVSGGLLTPTYQETGRTSQWNPHRQDVTGSQGRLLLSRVVTLNPEENMISRRRLDPCQHQ
ncbi:hypothetical protein O3P69_020774 [Scylla paramamosain]|uniref:Uncharacterized protein n=1 Tax=Scylla paramamosain TaxID=85552 RepID=A0AAW0TMN0_SCYPA